MLHLEKVLDDKERELLLQRGENSTLRERLRALEARQSNATSSHKPTTLTATTWRQLNAPFAVSSTSTDDNTNGDHQLPPSVLTQSWSGSGRGGTAPYPNGDEGRLVTPAAGWRVGQSRRGPVVPDQSLIVATSSIESNQQQET